MKFQSDTYHQTLSQFPHCKYCNGGPNLRTKLLHEKSLKLSDFKKHFSVRIREIISRSVEYTVYADKINSY